MTDSGGGETEAGEGVEERLEGVEGGEGVEGVVWEWD